MEDKWIFDLQFFAGGDDKTERPTQKKLTDARKEGQVAKSSEVATAFLFIAIFYTIRIFGGYIYEGCNKMFLYVLPLFADLDEINNSQFMGSLVMMFLQNVMLIVAPIFAVSFIIGFSSNFAQVGWNPTAKPLKPDFSRINPASGFKRMFSMHSLVELVKSILKITLISYIFYSDLKEEYHMLEAFLDMDLLQSILHVADVSINLGVKTGFIMIIIATADYAFQKYRHIKQLKMTKQEIKDEYKQAEGDPHIKGKIKQKMREISMRRMMQELPNADVVITNPTHFAVALKYDKLKAEAPYVVAKGADYMAKRIKDVAKDNNIEIVENKPLARALYSTVDVNETIPAELYQAVAEILAFVYNLKSKS